MEIKDIIHSKRLEKGLTMKELAKKTGVSEATISRWESGNISTMKQTKIQALADALGISPVFLVSGSDDTPATPPPMQLSPADIAPSFRGLLFIIRKYTASLADTEKSAVDTALDMIEHCLQRIESVLSKVKA